MKKLIVVSIAFLGLCSVSFAQDSKRAKQKQLEQEKIIKMKKEYQLKEKQAAKTSLLSGPGREVNALKQTTY